MTTTAAPAVDTVEIVPSFIRGSWWTPDDAAAAGAAPVLDASTGELLAKVSTEGLDLAAVVDYGRTTGQAELGTLTFHQRALKLKELAQYLNGRREEFYALSAQTGATKIDSMIDIDGGIGVLFTFGSKGRRELPNSQVVVDGPMEVLSRDGSFAGEHIYTRIPGVAVQINAFNFPVWGMLEKLAPAFLAGVPTIVKPATPTGYVAAAVVKAIDESGILPTGSLQLISGSVRTLLDHLDYRDLVAFTGSASTANTLKSHPNVVKGGVRFTSETDSLNAAILGPDAVKGTPEFDAFIKSLVTEMTAKAGQKCTSIRRAIVPQELVADVTAAVGDRIRERVVLGDPRAEGVTMGALASLEQLADVRAAVQSMLDAGGELAYGTLDAPKVTSADGSVGVVDGGAFMSPVLLSWANPEAEEVHSLEAFGPVSSVIGYTDLADAVRLAARGGGSLVATVCTNDPAVAQQLVTGIAAHHGRVLMLNREDARSSTGHGSPVPHLVHGGPGRAGGGEELGGIRSVMHHMQRTAIQGSPNMLTAVTGRLAHRSGPQLHARDRGPAPVPEIPGHPAHRRRHPLGAARGLAGGNHQVRELHRRHLLRPHQPGSRRGQPLLPGHRGARLPPAQLGRRPVRGARAGPGPGQLRPGEPAVHHPRGRGRFHPRDPDGQEDHPARDRRVRRGGLGRRPDQPERRNRRDLRRPDPRREVTSPDAPSRPAGPARTLPH